MLKIPAEYDRGTSLAKFTDICRQVSPCFATRCLVLVFARDVVDESGMIRTQMETQ
jgi:hypothetical protein